MVKQISRKTLQEEVYERLKESILRNQFLPGQVLSIERLSQDLGVSPTPVREALTILSVEGLVEDARNKQARVAKITEDQVRQTYEVRKLLEPYAARITAERIDLNPSLQDDLHQIKRTLEELQKEVTEATLSPSQYKTYLDIDLRLQEAMVDTLGDTLLRKLINLVGDHSLRIRSFTEASSKPRAKEVIKMNNKEHLAIIRALLDGSQKRVEKATKKHLTNAENRTSQAVKRTGEDEKTGGDR